MASSSNLQDLTCSLCLEIFTEPVSLSCGHSFCRECIAPCTTELNCCPLCRETLSTKEQQGLRVNHILKSLAEKTKVKEVQKREKKQQDKEDGEVDQWLCLEHEEKFKLFCVTDQQLACVICRDGHKHQGHTFKPIKEADASLREELKKIIDRLPGDIQTAENLSKTQNEEISKTRDEARQLLSQITNQFKEMYQFLSKREEEIKKELEEKERAAVDKMSENLKVIETALSESRDMEVRVKSVLDISGAEQFLQSWSEIKTEKETSEDPFRSRASKLQVTSASVSMGPYESHLQFFIWKEMLQVITPLPERLTLRTSDNLTVSQDGRSLFYTPQIATPIHSELGSNNEILKRVSLRDLRPSGRSQASNSLFMTPCYVEPAWKPLGQLQRNPQLACNAQTNHTYSAQEFTTGQHYWEVDVGTGTSWEVGIMNNYLKCDGQAYTIYEDYTNNAVTLTDTLSKVGVYLNCSTDELSFYNADDMRPVHTISVINMAKPQSAYFSRYCHGTDFNPLRVCWY